MYFVTVRGHIMIAHSFKGDLFGPAQKLHGATFVVDVEFRRPTLIEPENVVIDIGRALDELHATLGALNYRNLDEIPAFANINTTTEFVAKHVFDAMVQALKAGRLGPGSDGVTHLKVTLSESHVAWAGYEGPVS